MRSAPEPGACSHPLRFIREPIFPDQGVRRDECNYRELSGTGQALPAATVLNGDCRGPAPSAWQQLSCADQRFRGSSGWRGRHRNPALAGGAAVFLEPYVSSLEMPVQAAAGTRSRGRRGSCTLEEYVFIGRTRPAAQLHPRQLVNNAPNNFSSP